MAAYNVTGDVGKGEDVKPVDKGTPLYSRADIKESSSNLNLGHLSGKALGSKVMGFINETGTVDTDTANKCTSAAGNFVVLGVKVGDKILNVTDSTKGYVKAIDSATVLSCKTTRVGTTDMDLFPDGDEDYQIIQATPEIAQGPEATDEWIDNDGLTTTPA